MGRCFNTDGYCDSELHYMVDISRQLCEIKSMVDSGKYFTINRARQYGKTTILTALTDFLKPEYDVISLDFQTISYADFESEQNFVAAFSSELLESAEHLPREVKETFKEYSLAPARKATLSVLFRSLLHLCKYAGKKVVLIIDEVDTATNNQVFIDFLAQIRACYLKRRRMPVFQSVILAGVYDIKNIKRKLRQEDGQRENSPWNIAADFLVDMSFSAGAIAGMLEDYERDHHTDMNIEQISNLLYEYTSGYPFLVSRLCKLMDERIVMKDNSAWTKEGFLEAVRLLLAEPNTLFDSLINKLEDYPELDKMLRDLLFWGKEIAYVVGVRPVEIALMFGFIKVSNNQVLIANRIFETLLYNLFLAVPSMQQEEIYDAALKEKPFFIEKGHLNMKRVLERFVEHFDSLYGDRGQKFYEDDGRRYFMLFLKPIINGTGNCYVEAETRNRERTDLVVDYAGEQFIVETKLWHGAAKHLQGEEQLYHYLEHYHLETGYMLTFNFNKQKKTGVKEVCYKEKILIEAVV